MPTEQEAAEMVEAGRQALRDRGLSDAAIDKLHDAWTAGRLRLRWSRYGLEAMYLPHMLDARWRTDVVQLMDEIA